MSGELQPTRLLAFWVVVARRPRPAALENLDASLDEGSSETVFGTIGVYPDPDTGDVDE